MMANFTRHLGQPGVGHGSEPEHQNGLTEWQATWRESEPVQGCGSAQAQVVASGSTCSWGARQFSLSWKMEGWH